MLGLRHLHAHQKRNERQLKICNIASTFDFNGLKFHNTGNKRKVPCLSINDYGGNEFSKKICLNDVTSIFHNPKTSSKKNGLEDSKNALDDDATTIRSLSAVCTGTLDKRFVLGITNDEHQCLSYTAFKERHEMSKANIIKYAEHLNDNQKTSVTDSLKSYPIRSKELIPKLSKERILKQAKLKQVYSKLGKGKLKGNIEKNKVSKEKLKKNKIPKNKWSFFTETMKLNPCIKSEIFDESNAEGNIGDLRTWKSNNMNGNGEGTCGPIAIVHGANAFETNSHLAESDEIISKLPQKPQKPPKPAVEHLFKCNICTDSFVSQNTLALHLKFDHRPRPTCSQCHKMFECRRKLINHEANCSADGSPAPTQSLGGVIDFISPVEVFFCVKCENPFPMKCVLREHKILLNKRKPIALELTEETTPQSYSNNELWEICVKKIPSFSTSPIVENDYNKCGYCGKSFQSLRRFNQHSVICFAMKELHLARECEYCEKSFRDVVTRDRHAFYCSKRTHGTSLTLNDVYTCKKCNRVMSRLIDYNLHLRLEHDQRYCSKCKEMYTPDKVNGVKHVCKSRVKPMAKKSILLKNTFFKRKKNKKIVRSLTSTRVKRSKKTVWDFGTESEDSSAESLADKIDTVKENIPDLVNKPPTSSSDIMEVSKNIMEVSKNIMEVSKNIIEVNQSIIEMNMNENSNSNNMKKRTSRPSVKHLVTDNPGTTNSFHCIYCPDRNFTYRSGLDGHLRYRHNKVQCEYCGEIFRCIEHAQHDCLQTPAQTKHVTLDPSSIDSKNFDKTISITGNLDKTISITGKVTQTVPCENSEKDSSKIEKIVEVNDEPNEPNDKLEKTPRSKSSNFRCYKCSKTFTQKHYMIKHLVQHSKRNPYKCKYCRVLFKMPRHIDEHIRIAHYPHTYNQKKTHVASLIERHSVKKCNLCANFFLGVADLKSHQKTDHDFMKNNTKDEVSMCYTSTPHVSCSVCHKSNVSTKLSRRKGNSTICKDCSEALKSGIFQRLDKHIIKCEENEVMKPLIPATDACLFEFNFSSERCTEKVMTLEDAQASLQSLDVNYNAPDDDKKTKTDLCEPLHISPSNQPKSKDAVIASTCTSPSKLLPNIHVSRDSEKNAVKQCANNTTGLLKCKDYGNINEQKLSNTKENEDNFRILNCYQVFPCRECSVNFDSRTSLDYHVTNTHKNEIRLNENYACTEQEGVKKDKQDRMSIGDESGKENSNQLYCRVDHDIAPDIIPSPIGSPVFDPKQGGFVHYYPRPPPRPNDYRSKYPVEDAPINPMMGKDSPRWKGCPNPASPCKGKCNCCNVKYFHTPQFMNPTVPKQKKYVFYPGEYPTALLKKYLPHPPLLSYTPVVSENMTNSIPTRDFHNSQYLSATVHHPPYLFEDLMPHQHPEGKLGGSEHCDPYSVAKSGGGRKRKPKPDIVEKPMHIPTVSSSALATSPTLQASSYDVSVVSDLLKPLSPESLDKSIQNGSRPKYTKSEIALKMTRLADTLGRKFGARFKKNVVPQPK